MTRAVLLFTVLLLPGAARAQDEASAQENSAAASEQDSLLYKIKPPVEPVKPMGSQIQDAAAAAPGPGSEGQGVTLLLPGEGGGQVSIQLGSEGGMGIRRSAPPPGIPWFLEPQNLAAAVCVLAVIVMIMQRRPPPPPPSSFPMAGTQLGQSSFRIVRAISEGGMGVVYEAVDTNLDRRVAVKRMRDALKTPKDQEDLIKEAKTVASLHHPNIVDIHAVVSQGGETYLVFEFVEGKTLDQVVTERTRLALRDVKALLDPICRALEYAHGRGIIHRDLKLQNVMLTEHGQVKVMDFGIARQVSLRKQAAETVGAGEAGKTAEDYGVTRTLLGTPLYLSPEAEFGVVRPEVDVFALGVMFYRMLSGDWPFPPPASADMKLNRRYEKVSARVPGVAAGVDELVDRALDPDPEKRIHSAQEFRAKLAALAG